MWRGNWQHQRQRNCFHSNYFLIFTEYCTWIAPGVRCGRAQWISSHEQPFLFILRTVSFSFGVHRMRFLVDCNVAGYTLECASMLWGVAASAEVSLLEHMANALERTGKWRCSGTFDNWNSRLYIVLFLILMRLRKPWKGHSWYSATDADSFVIEGLREVRRVWWWL